MQHGEKVGPLVDSFLLKENNGREAAHRSESTEKPEQHALIAVERVHVAQRMW